MKEVITELLTHYFNFYKEGFILVAIGVFILIVSKVPGGGFGNGKKDYYLVIQKNKSNQEISIDELRNYRTILAYRIAGVFILSGGVIWFLKWLYFNF